MAFCTECGTNITDGVQFCTNCGKPMKAAKTRSRKPEPAVEAKQTDTVVTAPMSASAQPADAGNQGPPQESPYAVMSMGSFVLASILMSIPVIGLFICLIWAFGGSKNLNRRNYSRAFLILAAIGLVLGGLIALILSMTASSLLWMFM